jgi:aspartate/methionine/tyrosine aminotransferase
MFKVMDRARRLEEQGDEVFHLELGNPRLPPPGAALVETINSLKREEVGYTYSAGHPKLRSAIAAWLSRSCRRPIEERNIVISPANLIISQFLDLTCNPGDRVVFFGPAFPTYWAAAKHIGLQVETIALDPSTGFDLSDDAVSAALATNPTAIIVNSANNPTGAVYSAETLKRLALECNERGIWLLSDETYGEICFGGEFASLLDYDLPYLVVMSSFSKIFSVPGFRIGFAVSQPFVAEKFSLSVSTLISCLPIFTQLGAASSLNEIDDYTAAVRLRCVAMTRWCSDILRRAERIKFTVPRAGFYFFLDIGASGMDDMTFAQTLLEEQKTAVTPGSSFGEDYRHYVRIATCGQETSVYQGVNRLVSFVDQLKL